MNDDLIMCPSCGFPTEDLDEMHGLCMNCMHEEDLSLPEVPPPQQIRKEAEQAGKQAVRFNYPLDLKVKKHHLVIVSIEDDSEFAQYMKENNSGQNWFCPFFPNNPTRAFTYGKAYVDILQHYGIDANIKIE